MYCHHSEKENQGLPPAGAAAGGQGFCKRKENKMKRKIMLSIAAVMALTCFAACQGSGADGELTVNDVTDSGVSDTSIAGVTTAADQSGPREVWAGDDEGTEESAAPAHSDQAGV